MQQVQCTFVAGNSAQELESAAVLDVKTGVVELVQELQLDFQPDNEYIEIKGEREPLIREGNIIRVNDSFLQALQNKASEINSPKRGMYM